MKNKISKKRRKKKKKNKSEWRKKNVMRSMSIFEIIWYKFLITLLLLWWWCCCLFICSRAFFFIVQFRFHSSVFEFHPVCFFGLHSDSNVIIPFSSSMILPFCNPFSYSFFSLPLSCASICFFPLLLWLWVLVSFSTTYYNCW